MLYCITYSFVCEMRLAARRIGHIPNMPQFLPTSVLCWFHAARHISYSSQHLSDGASLVVPILSVISVSRFLIYTATQLFSSPRALGPSAMVGPPLGISLGYVLLCLADYFVSITVPSILVFVQQEACWNRATPGCRRHGCHDGARLEVCFHVCPEHLSGVCPAKATPTAFGKQCGPTRQLTEELAD